MTKTKIPPEWFKLLYSVAPVSVISITRTGKQPNDYWIALRQVSSFRMRLWDKEKAQKDL